MNRYYTVDDFNELLKNFQEDNLDSELDDEIKSYVEQFRTTSDSSTKEDMEKVIATRYEEFVERYKNKGKESRR